MDTETTMDVVETKTVDTTEEIKTKEAEDQLSLDPQVEKLRSTLAKREKELESLRKAAEVERLKKLKESENKEAYIKELEERAYKAEQEKTMYGQAYMEERKLEAIKKEAYKAGFNSEFDDMLEKYGTEGVEIETTSSGRINVINAASFVSKLKSRYPSMFKQKGSGINPESPTVVTDSELTYEKLMELKKKAGSNTRSKEWKEYESALKKYAAQT